MMQRTARLMAVILPVFALLGCGEAGILAPASGASLVVRPEISGGDRQLAAISTPYSPTSVYHLTIKVFSVAADNVTETQVAVNDLPASGLKNAVLTFSALKYNTHYRVRGYAYLTTGTAQQISTDASSQLDVNTTNDQATVIATLPVDLVDQTFNASTQTNITLTAGTFNSAGVVALAGTPTISTVLGTGTSGYLATQEVGLGLGTRAELNTPYETAEDAAGNVYVADFANHRVCKVERATGNLSVVAGTGVSGFSGDNNSAFAATLDSPAAVAVDASGNIYISDDGTTSHIRVVCKTAGTYFGVTMTVGTIYTLVGAGASTAEAALATAAAVSTPRGLTFDGSGNLLYSENGANNRVRMLCNAAATNYGVAMLANHVYTVVGGGASASDGVAGTTAVVNSARGLAVDANANLYYADQAVNPRVRMLCGTAGTYFGAVRAANNVYTIAGSTSSGNSADGTTALGALLAAPNGVAVDASRTLYFVDQTNNRVRMVPETAGTYYGVAMTANTLYTAIGGGASYTDGGAGTATSLNAPRGLCLDASSGGIVVADSGDHRVRLLRKSAGTFFSQAMSLNSLYAVAGNGEGGSSAYPDSGTGPGASAQLNNPVGLTLDGAGNLYVADLGNYRVRRVSATTGVASTYAGIGIANYSGDGGPATGARVFGPAGLAADAAGNLYIAEVSGNRVREVVAATGLIATVAGTGGAGFSGDNGLATSAQIAGPQGLALDASGNLYIADCANNRVRMLCQTAGTYFGAARTKGNIYTLAGNGATTLGGEGTVATTTALATPLGVAVDGAGNLYIAESGHARIRVVCQTAGTYFGVAMTAGNVYTVAGTGTSGFAGDNGVATSAKLNAPAAVDLDALGNLYVADQGNNRIRIVTPAGTISTLAGSGSTGYTGDGGAATAAGVSGPLGLVVSPKGVIYFSDSGNDVVRKVQ